MPAKSKQQFKFMQMMAHNKKRAKEYTESNTGKMSYSNLPEKKKKSFKVLKKK